MISKIVFLLTLLSHVTFARAETSDFTLPEMKVQGSASGYSAPAVLGGKILSGKKATVIPKSERPSNPNNHFREALGQIPGLIISEVNNESYASISYRGLGDPHESFNLLILRDGIPVEPDPYGYPAAYYVPPSESVDQMEFLRGGAGLLFGPQPGGALNMTLRQAPRGTRGFSGFTKNLGGSFGQYSSHTEISRGDETFGYLGSLHARGTQGFRKTNSASQIFNPRIQGAWTIDATQRWTLDLDIYRGRFEEPGGLARTPDAGFAAFADGIEQVTTPHDHMSVDRQGLVLGYENKWSAQTQVETKLWLTHFDRSSFRQTGTGFGKIATGADNNIVQQLFKTVGLDARVLHHYDLGHEEQTLTLAVTASHTDSPFEASTGASPTATSGVVTRSIDRKTEAQALVVENAFRKGAWTITPGVRIESISQKINETLGGGLRQADKNVLVTLGGLGAEYALQEDLTIYGNVSQAYKPPTFQDFVPLGGGDTISEDIQEARILSQELGLKGNWQKMAGDVSVFQTDFSNQFGRVGTNIQNVGKSQVSGLDLLVSTRLSPSFKMFANASFLHAKFTGGSQVGKTPQYSPGQTYRAGLDFEYSEGSKARAQIQSLSSHYGDDGNSANFTIPSHTVVDLSGEHRLRHFFGLSGSRLVWGVQNALDEKKWTRVRSNGVEPMAPRSYYAGLNLEF